MRTLCSLIAVAAINLLFVGCRKQEQSFEPFVLLVIPAPAASNLAIQPPPESPRCQLYLAYQTDLRDMKIEGTVSPKLLGLRRYELNGTGAITYGNSVVSISPTDIRINGQKAQTYCSYVLSPDGAVTTGFLRNYD